MTKKIKLARKVQASKKESAKPASKKVVAKATKTESVKTIAKPRAQVVQQHPVKFEYAGDSKPTGNVSRSRTPLRIAMFGKMVGSPLTERDENLLKNIKAAHGTGEFVRGNYDAGALSRLGERGKLAFLSEANAAHLPSAKLRLTKDA